MYVLYKYRMHIVFVVGCSVVIKHRSTQVVLKQKFETLINGQVLREMPFQNDDVVVYVASSTTIKVRSLMLHVLHLVVRINVISAYVEYWSLDSLNNNLLYIVDYLTGHIVVFNYFPYIFYKITYHSDYGINHKYGGQS